MSRSRLQRRSISLLAGGIAGPVLKPHCYLRSAPLGCTILCSVWHLGPPMSLHRVHTKSGGLGASFAQLGLWDLIVESEIQGPMGRRIYTADKRPVRSHPILSKIKLCTFQRKEASTAHVTCACLSFARF